MNMSTGAAHATAPEPADGPEPWPQGISRRATMRISDVLRALRAEFPHVSHSKLRFLEEQGLIEPVRTASGYRQYSPADVERLRFVLVEQRDRYLPLKVIKDRLAALDAGTDAETLAPRLAPPAGDPRAAAVRPRAPGATAPRARVPNGVRTTTRVGSSASFRRPVVSTTPPPPGAHCVVAVSVAAQSGTYAAPR